MRKLFNVLVLTLAMNFLAVAGAVGWLYHTGRMDREKALAIREIIFPKPLPTTQPATQPSTQPRDHPILRLEELLARSAGRSTTEQVRFIQHAFDAQMAQLERREREISDLQRQVDLAKEQLSRDRATLDGQRTALAARVEEQARLASDKGFQDSLAVYKSLPPRQVKTIFMALDDASVVDYLKSMEPRVAAKIIKEFKTPAELARIQTIMEIMRRSPADAKARE